MQSGFSVIQIREGYWIAFWLDDPDNSYSGSDAWNAIYELENFSKRSFE